jgi:uroporphyrinogen III methyltransferase/synthase
VTHREYSSSVHVITGHRRKDHTFDIDFASLAKTHGTLVFLMGISSLRMIVSGLIGAGMDPSTPAAVIEKGTTAAQKTLSSVLGKLEEDAVNAGIATPAIIIIGQVVSLAGKLAWHDRLPLDGIRTVVTRPKELSSRLAGMLREQGAEVIELPTVRIVPAEESADLDRAIDELADQAYDWLIFTSPSGVRIFMERIFRDHDIRILAGCRIACIGRGSERELGKYGIRPDMVPSEYNGQALGIQLAALLNEGDRVLIPRARIGNPELIEELSKVRDVIIDDIPSYDTEYTGASWFDADTAFDDECTYAVFTSASTVRGFVNSWPDMDHSKVRAVCIGRMTAREAQSHGMRTFVSSEATLESLVSELISVRRIDK